MHNNNNNHNSTFKNEERRRKVASMLAQSMTETEIAEKLNVDQSTTISRDVKALKEMSQQFVFDLAKSDLAYYYKECINGIEEVRRKIWEMLRTIFNLIVALRSFWLLFVRYIYQFGLVNNC